MYTMFLYTNNIPCGFIKISTSQRLVGFFGQSSHSSTVYSDCYGPRLHMTRMFFVIDSRHLYEESNSNVNQVKWMCFNRILHVIRIIISSLDH